MNRKPDMKQDLETVLAAQEDANPTDWERIRSEMVERADRESLIDVAYEMHDSPFGPLLVGASDFGLVRVGLPAEDEEDILEDIARRLSPRIVKTGRPEIMAARHQLDEYFAGDRHRFELTLDWQLTKGFRREVLRATDAIPYGETRSYAAMANEAGSPKAVRAAGSALATNPLPIVVPCHRVLRSDGKVGAYLGGTTMKEQLLEMERSG